MKIYKLKFFSEDPYGIIKKDFERQEKFIYINLEHIISISDLKAFDLPISETNTNFEYSTIHMLENIKFYIKPESLVNLLRVIDENNLSVIT